MTAVVEETAREETTQVPEEQPSRKVTSAAYKKNIIIYLGIALLVYLVLYILETLASAGGQTLVSGISRAAFRQRLNISSGILELLENMVISFVILASVMSLIMRLEKTFLLGFVAAFNTIGMLFISREVTGVLNPTNFFQGQIVLMLLWVSVLWLLVSEASMELFCRFSTEDKVDKKDILVFTLFLNFIFVVITFLIVAIR